MILVTNGILHNLEDTLDPEKLGNTWPRSHGVGFLPHVKAGGTDDGAASRPFSALFFLITDTTHTALVVIWVVLGGQFEKVMLTKSADKFL